MTTGFSPAARLAARNAAFLLVIGLLTGGYAASAMTGKIDADAHAALAAHLNAILGAFWLLGLGWTLPLLRFGPVGHRRLVWLTTVPNYANWAITAWKAVWRVAGVGATGEAKNDVIFGLLTAIVVIPSLAAGAAWIYGLTGQPPATTD